jgi:hypothetical protein
MPTVIYVHAATTVTFRPAPDEGPKLVLFRFDRVDERVASGALPLAPGIYRLEPAKPLGISGDHITVIALQGKDDPADPKVMALARELAPTASDAALRDFLLIDKDVSPG